MRKIILFLLVGSITALVPFFMLSCGSGSSSSGGSGGGFAGDSSSPGSVALYVTDTPADDYKQVTAAINGVQLVHIGTGAACDVLTTPVTVDITDLSSVLQLVDVESCPPVNYNRIIIEFDKRVVLTDLNNTTAECNFTSYKEGNNNPNVLLCTGNACSINISGAVNVISNQNNELALDFDLKDFEVSNFNQPSLCFVTMKVFPLNASDIDQRHADGFSEGIAGFISELDTIGNSFTLTAEGGTLTVTYADGIAPGIDGLLTLAATDQLKVKVEALIIDLINHTIAATALYDEVDGTVSELNTNAGTFTLTYQTNKTITVSYQTDGVEGTLLSGSDVEVRLNGFDGSMYFATEVEVK